MNYLNNMLSSGTRYHPRYQPSNNSDHMPMTLCAIVGLGGDESVCLAYQQQYSNILEKIPTAEPSVNWQAAVGDVTQYPALLAWLKAEIQDQGTTSVIRKYLPLFIESIAMDAFHPIIRLGYAIDFGSDAECAAALAYLMVCHRPTPISSTPMPDLLAAFIAQSDAPAPLDRNQRFSMMIQELIDTERYPTGRAETVQQCATLSLDIYRSTRNFFALHMVTACQAIRIIRRIFDDDLALSALTGALLAAHKVVGTPHFSHDQASPPPSSLDREHTFKYAWTCLSEFRHYADVRYADEIRAYRLAGLIPDWCAAEIS